MKALFLLLIRFYQRGISPFIGDCCRFSPSCSEYTAEGIKKFGVLKGLYLGALRILKCHPFHPGGRDPIP